MRRSLVNQMTYTFPKQIRDVMLSAAVGLGVYTGTQNRDISMLYLCRI